jgi:hypothetical protein
MIRVVRPGSVIRIRITDPDPDFIPIPDPVSRIPVPDLQHLFLGKFFCAFLFVDERILIRTK